METIIAKRVFMHDKKELTDPNPSWSPAQVLNFYATDNAELTTATCNNGEFKDNKIVFTFTAVIGTKG